VVGDPLDDQGDWLILRQESTGFVAVRIESLGTFGALRR
jgi:hypothetical protein